MVDFKKALADIKAKARPSLVPSGRKPRVEKVEEIIPELSELVDEPALLRTLTQQFDEHARIGIQERDLHKRRLLLGELLKDVCDELKLRKMQSGEIRASYYPVSRSKIDGNLLRGLGVSQDIIKKATVTTTQWTLRTGVREIPEEDEHGEES